MIHKIISGGQTGADQGGLQAGRSLGLQTGGWAPWNWMTEEGPKPYLLRSYGLQQAPKDPKTYPIRTSLNVRDSSCTLWVGDPTSPGGKLTIRLCREQSKPFIINPPYQRLWMWLVETKAEILNVAGNRESKNPGIKQRTVDLLTLALKGVQVGYELT